MKTKALPALMIGVLLLAACSQPDIHGNVFVVKENGDVKPAAGQTVHLTPIESRADLYYPASVVAFATVTEDLGDQLDPSCRAAGEFVTRRRNDIETGLSEIRQRGNVPESGCSDLEAESNRLESEIEELKATHSEHVANLQSELRDIRNRRSRKIDRRADELKNEALSKIIISGLKRGDGSSNFYKYKIINSSKYCVGGKSTATLYSRGVEIGSDSIYTKHNSTFDSFGFRIPCLLLPETNRTFWVRALRSSGPETRLLIAQHDLPTGGLRPHIIPDRIALDKDAIKLFNLSSNQRGARIEYTATPVNWSKRATDDMTFEEDAKIRSIQDRLSEIEKENDAHPLTESHARSRSAAESCASDRSNIQRLTDSLSALGEIENGLEGCTGGETNSSRALSALISLNEDFEQSFEVPEIEEDYLKGAIRKIAETLSSDTVKKMDATIEGAYAFGEISQGNYLLYSEYSDSFVNGFWLKPITVEGDARFDLNNNSFVPVRLSTYLEAQFRYSCMSCTRQEFENSMISESLIVALHGE